MVVAGCGSGRTANPRSAPSIDSTPPTAATVGVPYRYIVTAEGMTPMAFELVSGPEGFSVHPGSGMVTWTPSSAGTVSVELSATNLAGTDRQAFDVEVEDLTGPVFTTEPPEEATVGAEYSYDPAVVAAEDVTWSATVAPAGLVVDPETGAVRWTPTSDQAGGQSVTIRATEIESGRSTDQSFVVTVADTGGPAIITSSPPDRVYAGEVWSYDASASGAPTIQWTLETPSSGTPATGVIIATSPPEGDAVTVEWDTSGVVPEDYSIALQVFNGLGDPNVQEITVTVDPRPPVPEIDLATNPPPTTVLVGTTYDYDHELTPESQSTGVVWSLDVEAMVPPDLPITIDPVTGQVSFTASESNGEMEYRYTVVATNVLGESDDELIIVDAVYPPATPVLTVTPDTVFTQEVGESFAGASATATGQPTPSLSISGTLPDFLEFDPLTGLLSASSSKPAPTNGDIGAYSFDIVATNSEGSDSETIDVTVIAAPPTVDSITPAAGRRQSEVPIVVRGAGFVSAASPVIRLERGSSVVTLPTTFVDESTLTAIVPIDLTRQSGVYDVVVDQGSTTTLARRFTVTEGAGTVLGGTIGVDITLTALDSPHVITGDVRIENGATLTAEPGAVLMLGGGTNLRIDVGVNGAGAFIADGGEPGVDDQIVVTRFQEVGGPAPSGHYRGLRFGANIITASTSLRNVVVEFGGRNNADAERGAVEVLSGSAPRIHDSIIRESLNYGLYAQGGAGTDSTSWFDGNQLTANGRSPISIGSNEVSTLGASLDLLGNVDDRVFVRGSTVNRGTAAWSNYGVPFFSNSGIVVRGGSTLSIAPGTEIRFAAGRRLQVSTGTEPGALVAAGTPGSPIRMVADAASWDGIHMDDNVQVGTVLRRVRIEGFAAGVSGGLRVDNPDVAGDRVVIVENCVIQSSEVGSVGVYLAGNARLSSFEKNAVDAERLSVDAAFAGFNDALQMSNSYEAPLRVRGSTLSGEHGVWPKPLANDSSTQPIRPGGSLAVTDGSLTIAAGNRIEMPLNGQLTMTDSRLVVDGTAAEPVVFEPVAGADYWNRLRLRGTGSTGVSRITHAVLDSAGAAPGQSASTARAAIVVENSSGVPATPTVTGSVIVDSNGYGMTFADNCHCAGACNDNVIVGSSFSALRMQANFVGRFGVGNTMAGNNTSGTLGHEGVWVAGDVIDESATWPANDVVYVVHGNIELRQSYPLDPVPVWTIEPGSELRFASDRRLRVGEGNDGILDAQGTGAEPIVFTSIDTGTPVFWRGIDFNQGADGSVLDHVVVSYGGRSEDSGNVNFRSGSVVTLGVADLTHAEDYAAVIYAGSAPVFTGPSTDRVYMLNGQESIPGAGDPAFDCVRDVAAGECTQP